MKKEFIIFLDIDGPLANFRCSISQGEDRSRLMEYLDPIAIQFLNSLHREHNMKIVVISTWRKKHWENITTVIRAAGYIGNFGTPSITKDLSAQGLSRGDEIQLWLTENNKDANIIIIDDDSDMGNLSDNLILVDGMNGLTAQNMIEILDKIKEF